MAGIGFDLTELWLEGGGEADVLSDQPLEHLFRFFDDRIEIQNLALDDLLSAEDKKLAGQGSRPRPRFVDLFDWSPQRIIRRKAPARPRCTRR